MKESTILDTLTPYLDSINIKDSEELLIAMPAVATVHKISKTKTKKFINAFKKIAEKDVEAYIKEEIRALHNDAIFDEDLLTNLWRFQQFLFFIQEFRKNISVEEETDLLTIEGIFDHVNWSHEDVEKMLFWVNNAGLDRKEFLNCIQFASTESAWAPFSITHLSYELKMPSRIAAHTTLSLHPFMKLNWEETFTFKFGNKKQKSKIKVWNSKKTNNLICHVESGKGILPISVDFTEGLAFFEYVEENTVKATLNQNLLKNIRCQKLTLKLFYPGQHIIEILLQL